MKRHYIIKLKQLGDFRSQLVVVEAEKELPFKVKRLFYLYNVKVDQERGNHANNKSKFAFICLRGACIIEVDDGKCITKYRLCDPEKMLIIDRMVWKKMKDFSEDSILLVLSDSLYDKNEYIYNYSEYIERLKNF